MHIQQTKFQSNVKKQARIEWTPVIDYCVVVAVHDVVASRIDWTLVIRNQVMVLWQQWMAQQRQLITVLLFFKLYNKHDLPVIHGVGLKLEIDEIK